MKNKIIKIIGFVFIAQIFLYACCDDEFNVFISSFEFSAKDDADNDSASVANENFYILFRPDYQVDRVSSLLKNSGFINVANATTCDETYNMTKRVEEITITANVPLFGIEAGNSLNDHVIVEFQFNEGNQITMNDLLLEANVSLNSFDYFLRFDTEIPSMTSANFTMSLTFENEELQENTTSTITFE